VHIFSLNSKGGKEKNVEESESKDSQAKNSKSKFSFMKVFSSYFDSEWSFAQFKVTDRKSALAFAKE